MSTEEKRQQLRRQLIVKLREMFQMDQAELDFGIYRIMNARRDEVERFREKATEAAKRYYKDGVYALPCEGEEKKLNWANANQYYRKMVHFIEETFHTLMFAVKEV